MARQREERRTAALEGGRGGGREVSRRHKGGRADSAEAYRSAGFSKVRGEPTKGLQPVDEHDVKYHFGNLLIMNSSKARMEKGTRIRKPVQGKGDDGSSWGGRDAAKWTDLRQVAEI